MIQTVFILKHEFDEEFHYIKIKAVNAKRISMWGVKKISELESPEFHIVLLDLKYCYENKTPISDTKNKKDMLALCKDGTTPEEYHSYYNNIPSYSSVEDVVPEPDLYHEMDDE